MSESFSLHDKKLKSQGSVAAKVIFTFAQLEEDESLDGYYVIETNMTGLRPRRDANGRETGSSLDKAQTLVGTGGDAAATEEGDGHRLWDDHLHEDGDTEAAVWAFEGITCTPPSRKDHRSQCGCAIQ